MIKDVPYFPLYAANILSSRAFKLMTLEQRGLWITIQMDCWVNGSVPSDIASLSKYLGIPLEELERCLTQIQFAFLERNGAELISPELEGYRSKYLESRIKQSEGGKKGAANKKAKNEALEQEKLLGRPEGQLEGQPKGSLIQFNSDSINSDSINSTLLVGKGLLSNKEWVNDYEQASSNPIDYLKVSKG